MSLSAFLASATTALSRRCPSARRRFGHFVVLARASLCLGLLGMPAGCLVEDPPAVVAATRTRPRLDLSAATPPIDQIISRSTGDAIQFRVPVSSEDAGDQIMGLFFLDAATPLNFIDFRLLAPSTLDAVRRPDLSFDWRVPPGPSDGCHAVILHVGHRSNIEVFQVPPDDVATAVWWLNINPNPEDPDTLFDCPSVSLGATP